MTKTWLFSRRVRPLGWWGLWFVGLALVAGLAGCPKKVVINRDLFCQRGDSRHCLTPEGFATPSPTATSGVPLYDTNGPPLTCWRFVEEGKTIGILLTGESTHPFTAPLVHAFYYAMLPYSSPSDLLGAGYALVRNPGGAQTGPQYMQMLSNWDTVFEHLSAAGWLRIRQIDAARHRQRIERIRKDIQRFANSSHSRTVLYYPDKAGGEPLLLPVLSLQSEPQVAQGRFPVALFPSMRARALGEFYYNQQYEDTKPFWKALWPLYNKNVQIAESLTEIKFKCSHHWHQLFHVYQKKMSRYHFHLYRELQRADNPNARRREYCTKQNLKQFRASKAIQKQIRRYRKTLDALNDTFQDLLGTYNKAYSNVKILKDLNISTFLDAYLRGKVLYFTGPIRVRGRIQYPQELMLAWMRSSRARIWRLLLKDFQQRGLHLQVSGKVGGALQHPYTFFRIRKIGTDYLVRPYYLIGGPFALVLDRARGVIEVLTPHHVLTQHQHGYVRKQSKGAKQVPQFIRSQTQATQKPPARTARKQKQAPLLFAPNAFYQATEKPTALLRMSRQPFKRQRKPRQVRQRRLYRMIHRSCPVNTPVTPIRHNKVQELPNPIPEIPDRSFAIKQGYFWMRVQCNLLVIPVTGETNIPTSQQKQLARQIEQAALQHDAIPSRILIESLQPPRVKVEF